MLLLSSQLTPPRPLPHKPSPLYLLSSLLLLTQQIPRKSILRSCEACITKTSHAAQMWDGSFIKEVFLHHFLAVSSPLTMVDPSKMLCLVRLDNANPQQLIPCQAAFHATPTDILHDGGCLIACHTIQTFIETINFIEIFVSTVITTKELKISPAK